MKLLSLILLLLFSCTFNQNEEDSNSNEVEIPGMVFIPSAGKSFYMGSSKEESPIEERPAFKVHFNYDYYISETEITQKEFQSLLNPDTVLSNPNNPQAMVSFFDAVLYCNSRSMKEGFDTVYIYSQVLYDAEGNVVDLVDLTTRFEIFGYRLPTEAEWNYAAKMGEPQESIWPKVDSVENYGWFIQNSENHSHEVKTKKPNSMGIYDLAGNLLEMTNDWKDFFPHNEVENYIGAAEPNLFNEKVVKGGSYTSQPVGWNKRSDTYTINVKARLPYMGFRVSLGEIHSLTLTNSQDQNFEQPRLVAEVQEIHHFFKERKSKLVYVDRLNGNLVLWDFSTNTAKKVIYYDNEAIAHPSISPDGRWIAYTTTEEGDAGYSKIKVRPVNNPQTLPTIISRAGGTPRWQKTENENSFLIIYPETNGSNEIFDLWKTLKTKSNSILLTSTVAYLSEEKDLEIPGAYNGGFSNGLDFFASGYTKLIVYDKNSNTVKELFKSPENGKDENGSSQVCNVSISPDQKKEVLFIDFGYPRTSTIIGSSYGIHEYLFKVDQNGSVIRYYKVPEGWLNWNDPEYSNDSEIAIALSADSTEVESGLWAINLNDSSYLQITGGGRMRMPNLWLGDSIELLSDTLYSLISEGVGQYAQPEGNHSHFFSVKFNRFWNEYEKIEWAIVGSSHAMTVQPELIEDVSNGLNISWSSQSITEIEILIEKYLLRSPNLKIILFPLDFGLWLNHDYFAVNLGMSSGWKKDDENDYWVGREKIITEASNYEMLDIPYYPETIGQLGGVYDVPGAGWDSELVFNSSNDYNLEDSNAQIILSRLMNIINVVTSKGIQIGLIDFPQSPAYSNSNSHGIYGPSHETWKELIQYIQTQQKLNPLIHYWDENQEGQHDYSGDEVLHTNHLSTLGGAKFTRRLSDSLGVWLGKK